MKPDKIVLKEGLRKSQLISELYGIHYTIIEGSTSNQRPLNELAEIIQIDISELQCILKNYSLLDENNEISVEECLCESSISLAARETGEMTYAFTVLSKVFVLKKGKYLQEKFIESDFEPASIYGNVTFITELVKLSKRNEIILNVIGEIKTNSLVLIEQSGISRMQKEQIKEMVRELGLGKAILMFVNDPQKDAAVLDINENSLVLLGRSSIDRATKAKLKESSEKRNWPEFIYVNDPRNEAIIFDEKEMNEKGWYKKSTEGAV